MHPRIAFVTGASRGIGLAVAKALAKAGYHLAINSRKDSEISDIAKRLSEAYHIVCMPFGGDVADPNFITETFIEIKDKLGNIELLVNNAGISHVGLLTDMSLEEWNRVINTNLTASFLCCKAAIPQMLERKSGKIIQISSVWGNVGASCEVAYSASKGGIHAFTKALAKELAPSGIQVNAIACGAIDTRMNECFTAEELRILKEEIPTGRFGLPQEVANVVLSLADCPSYLTGQVISLDGGWV